MWVITYILIADFCSAADGDEAPWGEAYDEEALGADYVYSPLSLLPRSPSWELWGEQGEPLAIDDFSSPMFLSPSPAPDQDLHFNLIRPLSEMERGDGLVIQEEQENDIYFDIALEIKNYIDGCELPYNLESLECIKTTLKKIPLKTIHFLHKAMEPKSFERTLLYVLSQMKFYASRCFMLDSIHKCCEKVVVEEGAERLTSEDLRVIGASPSFLDCLESVTIKQLKKYSDTFRMNFSFSKVANVLFGTKSGTVSQKPFYEIYDHICKASVLAEKIYFKTNYLKLYVYNKLLLAGIFKIYKSLEQHKIWHFSDNLMEELIPHLPGAAPSILCFILKTAILNCNVLTQVKLKALQEKPREEAQQLVSTIDKVFKHLKEMRLNKGRFFTSVFYKPGFLFNEQKVKVLVSLHTLACSLTFAESRAREENAGQLWERLLSVFSRAGVKKLNIALKDFKELVKHNKDAKYSISEVLAKIDNPSEIKPIVVGNSSEIVFPIGPYTLKRPVTATASNKRQKTGI